MYVNLYVYKGSHDIEKKKNNIGAAEVADGGEIVWIKL